MIVALSGGTGGAKMLDGLASVVGQSNLAAIINTADDDDFHGLRVCPDIDICTYTLAGVVDERGWGYADDTFRCLDGLATYGRESWFGLGDRDLATHLHRTLMLGEGATLSEVTADICRRMGVVATLLPMSNEPVRTRIATASGSLSFEEYLVRDGAREDIQGITFTGIEDAHPAPGVIRAIQNAQAIVIGPSSPVVSIGTILAVPGVRDALRARRADVIGVSPIIGDAPVEGPGHKFLAGVGETECTATSLARMYADVCGAFLIATSDRHQMDAITALGVRAVPSEILMPDRLSRHQLAERVVSEIC